MSRRFGAEGGSHVFKENSQAPAKFSPAASPAVKRGRRLDEMRMTGAGCARLTRGWDANGLPVGIVQLGTGGTASSAVGYPPVRRLAICSSISNPGGGFLQRGRRERANGFKTRPLSTSLCVDFPGLPRSCRTIRPGLVLSGSPVS